jgi:A/G-specific adenine glycosylase
MNVSRQLGKWYDGHKRDLPWRKTNDPYKIWISEIILQQTRVNQGIDYYNRFLLKFPSLVDLSQAPIEAVLKIWQGLGYYSRARNLHAAAKSIVSEYSGEFPRDMKLLKKLKGIGDYSAAAISSMAFNQPNPVLDGNVYRVLSRLYEIDVTTDSAQGKKQYYDIALKLLDKHNPGRHNQAIMELGALVCLPLNPNCTICPLAAKCSSYLSGTTHLYPSKKRKAAQRNRFFNYFIIRKPDSVFIRQRKEGDIWAFLFEFPLIETEKAMDPAQILTSEIWNNLAGKANFKIKNISAEYKHKLSHQLIHAWFIEVEVDKEYILNESMEIEYNKLSDYPVSRLTDKYLKDKRNFK